MKRILSLAIAATAVISSCGKDKIQTVPLSSINIINAIVNGATAKLGSNTATIANNANTQFALKTGVNNLYIYPSTDSLKPYYSDNKFTTNEGEVYSLFLAGTVFATDAVLIKESIPYRTDSTAGIRFINLSPNSIPLNITLSTTATVNEVTGLAYKQYTAFKSYPGLYNSAYTFQVRQADGTLLTTFSLNASTVPRFANITVVIRGQMIGSPAIGTTRINHDR